MRYEFEFQISKTNSFKDQPIIIFATQYMLVCADFCPHSHTHRTHFGSVGCMHPHPSFNSCTSTRACKMFLKKLEKKKIHKQLKILKIMLRNESDFRTQAPTRIIFKTLPFWQCRVHAPAPQFQFLHEHARLQNVS